MRRQKEFTVKVFVSLLILSSLIFNACSGSGDYAANTNTSKANSARPDYSMSNAASTNSNAAFSQKQEGIVEEESRNSERYAEITENPFLETNRAPLSTFSIDVDTASYTNARRYLNDGQLPPKDAVRIEEFINYFEYEYPQPVGNLPFSVNTEVATAPWKPNHKIVQIGLQGRNVSMDNTPPSNLVFLVDVSGSMNDHNKLPLLKDAFRTLVNQLKPTDRVAIAVYAGSSGLILPSTAASEKQEILNSLERLQTGGGTNGGEGIKLAYTVALNNFIQGGNNRVILATDGDFNLGLSGDDELVRLIEEKRRSGVFLSVLGFGSRNLNDSMMEKLADKGNGNYSYIDSEDEARKALGQQVAGTLYTIAKDVKIQVEFNPALVAGYRLIGYENRLLADKDFNDDKKDAGEIGAGHSVTALYEIIPAGQKVDNDGIELKYSKFEPTDTKFGNELLTVKLRYKEPDSNQSQLITTGVLDANKAVENASDNLKFASAVAQFGMLLRDSHYKGSSNFGNVYALAANSRGNDLKNYRGEFINLVEKAKRLND